jgi:hypothetical protein
MTRARAAFVLVASQLGVFACSPPPAEPPPKLAGAPPPPPQETAASARPSLPVAASSAATQDAPPVTTGPDAALDLLADRLETPLVSTDGKVVALFVGVEGADGDRITPLRLVDADKSRELRSISFSSGAPDQEKLAGLAEAQSALDTGSWLSTTAHEMKQDPTKDSRQFGLGEAVPMMGESGGMTVRFHEPVLSVTAPNGKTWLRRAFPAWSKKGSVGGQPCVAYADLAQAFSSREARVLVVQIRYATTPDFCASAPETFVVRLPAEPR